MYGECQYTLGKIFWLDRFWLESHRNKRCHLKIRCLVSKCYVDSTQHGKYWGWNGSTDEISCWADLAWPLAGIKNSRKNLCSHVIFIVFFNFLKRNVWWWWFQSIFQWIAIILIYNLPYYHFLAVDSNSRGAALLPGTEYGFFAFYVSVHKS